MAWFVQAPRAVVKSRIDAYARQLAGLTFIELLLLIALVAVLLGLLLPTLSKTSRRTRPLGCVRNLKEVGLAFRIFATDHEGRFPMRVSTNQGGSLEFVQAGLPGPHFVALSNALTSPKVIVCPMDKKSKPAASFTLVRRANVSYFVGLDATEEIPETFLAGDRHLTVNGRPVPPGLTEFTTNAVAGWTDEIHRGQGFVAMGDGSVHQFSPSRLDQALRGTGQATNRLVIP